MTTLKRLLTPANAIAALALFCALGGSAYAVGRATIGAPQLKRGAVTTAKVRDGSLRAADFKPGQLPAGPTGAAGVQGPKGDRGPAGDAGPAGAGKAVEARREAMPVTSMGQKVTVATLSDLPAGAYVLTAKVDLALTSVGSATCSLQSGADRFDDAFASAAALLTEATMQSAQTFPVKTSVSLVCSATKDWIGSHASVLAVPYGTVSTTAVDG